MSSKKIERLVLSASNDWTYKGVLIQQARVRGFKLDKTLDCLVDLSQRGLLRSGVVPDKPTVPIYRITSKGINYLSTIKPAHQKAMDYLRSVFLNFDMYLNGSSDIINN